MVSVKPSSPKRVPSAAKSASPGGTSPRTPEVKEYTVKKGDTLTSIARDHKVKVDALAAMNPQIENRDVLRAGSVVKVPATGLAETPTKKDAKSSDEPTPARRPAPPEAQTAARRGAAGREKNLAWKIERAASRGDGTAESAASPATPARPAGGGSRTLSSRTATVEAQRRVGDDAAAAAIDNAAGRFGQLEGQNAPWSTERSLDRTGARFRGSFSRELNTPSEVAKLDERLGRARVTRANGTFRESGTVEATAGLRDGVKLQAGYNNQAIAWGYKAVGEARGLPAGFTAQGKSKVAAGTYGDVGADAEISWKEKGPNVHAGVRASLFGGARNISEGSISSPRGILTASGHASAEGGAGAAIGAEAGLKDGRLVVGANMGAKVGLGLELGGKLELNYIELFRTLREGASRMAPHVQSYFRREPPTRLLVQGWFQ